jgi:hypothetical protein
MANPIDQLDEAIESKSDELKALLFVRHTLERMARLAGDSRVVISVQVDGKPLALGPAPEEVADSPAKASARRKAPLIDKKDRKAAIAAAAGKTTVRIPKHQGEGGRRKFTTPQKLRILSEYEKAPRKKDILEKYMISPSLITSWKAKKKAGELRPSPREPEVSSLVLPDVIDDVPVVEEAAPPSPFFDIGLEFLPRPRHTVIPFRDYDRPMPGQKA